MQRELLEKKILRKLGEPVRYAAPLDASLAGAHRARDGASTRRPGRQALRQPVRNRPAVGCLAEMRVNSGQEFVIGGYTVGTKTFDARILDTKRATG